MDQVVEHLRIASERACSHPEVASANALAAIGILLEQLVIESWSKHV